MLKTVKQSKYPGFQKPLPSGCPKSLILQPYNCRLHGFQKDLRLMKNVAMEKVLPSDRLLK
jgi:hypothetical protein